MALGSNKLKFLQSLQNRKFRRKYGYFIVEGEKAVREFCEGSLFQVDEVYSTEELFLEGLDHSIDMQLISQKEMDRISAFSTPSPAAALVQIRAFDITEYPCEKGWAIAVDRMNDPGNLGTMIRIADWYGLDRIYIGDGSVDAFNPKTISSSMGSLSRVMPINVDLQHFLDTLSIPCYAAVLDGKDVKTIEAKKGLLLIGSESHGIEPKLLESCEELISIGRIGKAESLNAAIATAILCERLIRG